MFKALATLQYSFSSAKVYVIRGHVAKGFVIAPRGVVGDKPRVLLQQIVGNTRARLCLTEGRGRGTLNELIKQAFHYRDDGLCHRWVVWEVIL